MAWHRQLLAITYPLCLGQGLLGDDSGRRALHVSLLAGTEPCCLVHAPAAELNESVREPVARSAGLTVRRLDAQHLLLCVAWVGPGRRRLPDVGRLLGWKEVPQARRGSRREGRRECHGTGRRDPEACRVSDREARRRRWC